jgi:pimeloyl-ACP methyl ester carboxylesterase
MMAYQEIFVQRDQHRIYVRDHPGAEPAIILMHGFPDNVHLYDRLSPYLSPPRRVLLFGFLGWGRSDKPLIVAIDTTLLLLLAPAPAAQNNRRRSTTSVFSPELVRRVGR